LISSTSASLSLTMRFLLKALFISLLAKLVSGCSSADIRKKNFPGGDFETPLPACVGIDFENAITVKSPEYT